MLTKKGYKSGWAIDKHVVGCQIFDYWRHTTGNMVEHSADGDVINLETPMALEPTGHKNLAVWGPEVPKSFVNYMQILDEMITSDIF